MEILSIIIVFTLLGIWLMYVQHKYCEINKEIVDFCYTISTGKDSDEY